MIIECLFKEKEQYCFLFMKLVFFESPVFSRYQDNYLDDDEYRLVQNALLAQPEKGDIISETGGFRKLRWENAKRHKGKRGGLRIIYYYLPSQKQIWFFTLYDKNEMEDLSNEQKKLLKQAIQAEKLARKEP